MMMQSYMPFQPMTPQERDILFDRYVKQKYQYIISILVSISTKGPGVVNTTSSFAPYRPWKPVERTLL
jgi:hypothetical protein